MLEYFYSLYNFFTGTDENQDTGLNSVEVTGTEGLILSTFFKL